MLEGIVSSYLCTAIVAYVLCFGMAIDLCAILLHVVCKAGSVVQ